MKALKLNFSLLFITLTLFILLGGIFFLFSQERTGNITGIVTDENGNPLPGVTIEATSPKLIGKATVVTSEEGLFRFSNLPTGIYRVTLILSGFKTAIREEIMVKMGDTSDLEVAMLTALIDEEITATSVSPVVDQKEWVTVGHFEEVTAGLSKMNYAVREDVINITGSTEKLQNISNRLARDVITLKKSIEELQKLIDKLENRIAKIEEKVK